MQHGDADDDGKGAEAEHLPPQHQDRQPGIESRMHPAPEWIRKGYRGAEKLAGKRALVTGGDSGIGRAVAVHFAREGADVAIVYLDEESDARETKRLVELEGRKCMLVPGDVGDPDFCAGAVDRVVAELGGLDILVNNAAEQHPVDRLEELTDAQLERTFRTNVFGGFAMVRAALPHLAAGSVVLNTASITAYRGHEALVDYAATKGAIVAFTRSLAGQLVDRGIRVNGVAPGPIWTPLIPSTFSAEEVAKFGADTPMKRAGQPSEVAPCFVFLASEDASYLTGQFLHPNGGQIVNT